ncbi:putative alanine and glycine rich protein [Mycobacterium numidiamassiliense]|uniref:Putative alanine and glycine rich protein n=1 Tax=Mycobacterium numidiamassiliense TaxID=1841861 RepID=A0A2U3P7Q8_9MYCO|nr:hypothetical protein [Mycobacterium numidiamassiliense]SPM39705.1 putative alanine and glycine rich protein [Mycobacterium numidiamassiliense]
MTQPQTLNVEYDELLARAAELEKPLANIPTLNPPAPCALSYSRDAARQIALSADMMRLYLRGCEREWKSLAKSLRDAAKAYEEVDDAAADTIDSEGSMLDVTPAEVGAHNEGGAFVAPDPLPMSAAFDYPYYEVRQAVIDIENGDQGAAFTAFADAWDDFQRSLQDQTYRFRPFNAWEGDARSAVEGNFEQQRQWIFSMVGLCTTLSKQARGVVDAQKQLRAKVGSYEHDPEGGNTIPAEHPGPIDISNVDYWYKWYTENDPTQVHWAIRWYQVLQDKSEEALTIYVSNASLPLPPVNPSMFPTVSAIPDFKLGSDGPGDIESGELPPGDSFSGMPQMPSLPMGGMPSTPDGSMPAAAAPQVPPPGKDLPKGPGIKPASLGGGGGVPSVPSAPLQSWGDNNAATAGAAAGPGRSVPVPDAYAALNGKGAGGGMGGGMPMGGAGGQGQGQGKGKAMQEQKAIYTEKRQWTEGVIGRRPQKGAAEHDKATRPKYPVATAPGGDDVR